MTWRAVSTRAYLHLLLEALVVKVPAREAHVGGGLDDGPGGDVQEGVDVQAVGLSQALLAAS
jgi:hypothetical protein